MLVPSSGNHEECRGWRIVDLGQCEWSFIEPIGSGRNGLILRMMKEILAGKLQQPA
jgi:hypothetical protein